MHNHSNGNELRILIQIKLISLTIVEHQDSLRNQDKQQLRNGPLICVLLISEMWKMKVSLIDDENFLKDLEQSLPKWKEEGKEFF